MISTADLPEGTVITTGEDGTTVLATPGGEDQSIDLNTLANLVVGSEELANAAANYETGELIFHFIQTRGDISFSICNTGYKA